MKNLEKFSGIFLIAGFFLLFGAIASLGIVPALMVEKLYPRQGLPAEIPVSFQDRFQDVESFHQAVLKGRDHYISEGCWHCHSQFVRPVAQEDLQYGPVSTPGEFQSVLHLPQLFGTRRVGPDLSREAGKRSNDWHYAHLYKPTSVEPESVMPEYSWYFTVVEGIPTPTEDGVALVAYLQTLGSDFAGEHLRRLQPSEEALPPHE